MTVKVLIASSNHALSGRYRTQLPVQEFLIIQASDGLQCLETLRRCRPHVLILDEGLLWGGAEGVLARLHEEGDLLDMVVICYGNLEVFPLQLSVIFSPDPDCLADVIRRALRWSSRARKPDSGNSPAILDAGDFGKPELWRVQLPQK